VEHLFRTAAPSKDRRNNPSSGIPSGAISGMGTSCHPVSFPSAVLFFALLLAGLSFVVILLTDDSQLLLFVSDAASPLIDFGACLILFWAAGKTAGRYRDLAVAWNFFALAMLMSTLGGIVRLILEVVLKVGSFPSVADVFYLAYYPFFLAGLFCILERRATVGEWVTRGLDLLILLGAAVLGFWTFLIEPASISLPRTVLDQLFLLAYPVGDLLLSVTFLLFLYKPHAKQEATPILILAAGVLIAMNADAIYSRLTLLSVFYSVELLNNGWIVSSLLVGLAGLAQYKSMQSQRLDSVANVQPRFFARLSSIRSYLPYFILIAVFVMLGPPETGSDPLQSANPWTAIGVAALVLLVVIRQILALRENDKLAVRLMDSMKKIQLQADELMESNRKLELDIEKRERAERARRQSEAMFQALFALSPDAIMIIDPYAKETDWPIVDCNQEACRINGFLREEMIGKSIDLVNLTPGTPEERKAFLKVLREEEVHKQEVRHRRKNGDSFFIEVTTTIINVGGRELIVGIDHDITDRKQKENLISHRLAELEAINQVSSTLRTAQTLEEMLSLLLDETLEAVGASQGSIWLNDPVKAVLNPEVMRGPERRTVESGRLAADPGRSVAKFVFESGKPLIAGAFRESADLPEEVRNATDGGIGGAVLPIFAEKDVIGALIVNVPPSRELTADEIRLLGTLSEIAGIAIRRISLSQQTSRRLQRLSALSEISRAITSSVSLQLNLSMLLNQVVTQLDIDAADVLLMNPALGTLEYAAGNGFRIRTVERTHQKVGVGYAGTAAMERRIIHVDDLAGQGENPFLAKVEREGFVSYFAVPLIAKGQVQGVLELFHRTQREHDGEWLEFLQTLAEQAAIAVENANMFENLERTNLDLVLAYDATIEGWSRALDLRDRETEGHTQRVADLTIRLARLLGLGESELTSIRWGALLHDIGKMGVPDQILLKPGALTDAEWATMRKHPELAYDMLSPIHYLRSSLDIPHYHHERWDGTGYPEGLKGERIPLTARIFAVVDVWDALLSNRPYRSAWPEEKVREHLRSRAGSHFDPKVVEKFMQFEQLEGLED
jgi:PAS domain S-box-containing protein/putative nucleotidyltransferase with HDIG domain